MASAMATAAASSAQLSGVLGSPVASSAPKSSFFAGSGSVSMLGCSNGSRMFMAEWLPGNPRPAYLDGSAPGSPCSGCILGHCDPGSGLPRNWTSGELEGSLG